VERLNESHKQALRFFVKGIRAGEINEEFYVYWLLEGPRILGSGKGDIAVPGLTLLTMDILTDEGLIYSRIHSEVSSSSHGLSTRQRVNEDYRTCFVTPDGFRAVDSDFAIATDVSVSRPPIEILESLARFRMDFSDNTRIAFIMMQFGTSTAHKAIHERYYQKLCS